MEWYVHKPGGSHGAAPRSWERDKEVFFCESLEGMLPKDFRLVACSTMRNGFCGSLLVVVIC